MCQNMKSSKGGNLYNIRPYQFCNILQQRIYVYTEMSAGRAVHGNKDLDKGKKYIARRNRVTTISGLFSISNPSEFNIAYAISVINLAWYRFPVGFQNGHTVLVYDQKLVIAFLKYCIVHT